MQQQRRKPQHRRPQRHKLQRRKLQRHKPHHKRPYTFVLRLGCLLLVMVIALAQGQGAGALMGEYQEAYYPLRELNAGLAPISVRSDDAGFDVSVPNLQTPRATLEFFVRSARAGDFARAARALNLNLLPPDQQRVRASDLAEQLFYILDSENLIDFTRLPDRPDGQLEQMSVSQVSASDDSVGVPRRSWALASLDIAPHSVSLRLQRVRVADTAPVWVFSASTVENIPALYETYGPNIIDRWLPRWLKLHLFGIVLWELLAFGVLLALALLFAWLTSRLSRWVLKKTSSHRLAAFVRNLTVPLTISLALGILFGLSSGVLPFTDAFVSSVRSVVWILFAISLIWLGVRTIDYVAERMFATRINNLGDEYNDLQRQRRTMLSLGRRVFTVFMVLIGVGIMLSQFADLASLGATLLTSAGVAGVVIGIAARPVLTNLVAGMQVALTQPVRIGDSIIFEDTWSYVEDLGYTYATIRTWDERRFLVPMHTLITERIENWDHTNRQQAGSVYMYVDYQADIAAIRETFFDLVKASDLWTGVAEPEVLVYAFLEDRVVLRGKAAARNPANAWALECNLREQLVSYLQEHPEFLPRERRVISATKERAVDAVALSHD